MISFEQVEEKIIKENWKITLGRGIAIDRQVVEFGLWSEQDFQQWVSRDKMPEPAKLLWSSMGEPQDQNLWTKRTKPEGIREWGQEAAVRECWRRRTTRRSLGSWLVWWKRQRGEMAWPARALALFFFIFSNSYKTAGIRPTVVFSPRFSLCAVFARHPPCRPFPSTFLFHWTNFPPPPRRSALTPLWPLTISTTSTIRWATGAVSYFLRTTLL